MSYSDCLNILKSKLASVQRRNDRYTLRAYSRDLEVNVTSLSLALRGMRQLSAETLNKISLSPHFNTKERMLLNRAKKTEDGYDKKRLRLDDDNFQLIADWHHLAILNLIDNQSPRLTKKVIQSRFGLDSKTTDEALERLTRLNLLAKENGTYKRTAESIEAGDRSRSLPIQKHHAQKLDLAKKALDLPLEKRHFSSVTFSFDPKNVEVVAQEIKRFRRSIEKKYLSQNSNSVYTMCIQLFPLTKEP
jgi:uncharacterized protein (TIGR02147 family)